MKYSSGTWPNLAGSKQILLYA